MGFSAEDACDDRRNEEQDERKLYYFIHAFASFAAFLAALRSSLVTPNWRPRVPLSIAHAHRFMMRMAKETPSGKPPK